MKHPHSDPIVGNWYAGKGLPESFTVVDAEQDNYVDIQYLDGELDQLDIESWKALNPEEIPEPEDAMAPYGVDHEDRDIVNLLNDIEDQTELDEHLHNLDSDDGEWQ